MSSSIYKLLRCQNSFTCAETSSESVVDMLHSSWWRMLPCKCVSTHTPPYYHIPYHFTTRKKKCNFHNSSPIEANKISTERSWSTDAKFGWKWRSWSMILTLTLNVFTLFLFVYYIFVHSLTVSVFNMIPCVYLADYVLVCLFCQVSFQAWMHILF